MIAVSRPDNLFADNRGNSVVEMALYLPLALMFLGGVVDFSLAVSQKLQAQQAVARTLEMVGNLGVSDLSEARLRAEAAGAAGVTEDDVAVRIWLECDGVMQGPAANGCATSDALARYASLTIESTYDLPFLSRIANLVQQDKKPAFQVRGSLRVQ